MAGAIVACVYACTQCGAEFSGHKRKFCTAKCRDLAAITRKRDHRDCERGPIQPTSCNHCGDEFMPKHRANTRFCSVTCKQRWFGKDRSPGVAERANLARQAADARRTQTAKRAELRALVEQEAMKRRAAADRARADKLKPRPCRRCGTKFTPKSTGQSVFCTERCRRRCHKGERGTHRSRAVKAGVAYQPINRTKVFERDGWKCQVCGRTTPQRLCGSTSQRAPELDHRVPFAMGGGHTWDNVQCACRECNARKGGTHVIGQMRLAFDIAA